MKASTLRRHGSIEPTGAGVVIGALHPAFRSGRSIFSSRVFDPDEVKRVLKDGHQSRKIGKVVQKGHWRGFPIFTLTLEERATCPRECPVWGACYGNNMQAAERITAGPELEASLHSELAALQRRHPKGFVVRLHVLGDFYSPEYASLWVDALDRHPALHVFGYTARSPFDPIGSILHRAAARHWDRFAIRFSGAEFATMTSEVVAEAQDATGIICPAQTGRTECCATCALCWATDRKISFLRH